MTSTLAQPQVPSTGPGSRVDKKHLLNTEQMLNFVSDGLLRFDELVPDEINQATRKVFDDESFPRGGGYRGGTLDDLLAGEWADTPIARMLSLPQVQGIIQSLVGPSPLYDHHAVHKVGPQHHTGQTWHADAIIDTRIAFDIQLFYYCHDTPREMGGTMFLPGSQYRQVNQTDIGGHQNFLNQMPVVCKAGTVLVGHHGLWHCAQPNHTDDMRFMFKLRLNPTWRQLRLWNTDDLDEANLGILGRNHRWYGSDDRLEYVNRIKQWRYLTGDDSFDLSYWMTRLENDPQRVLD